MGRSAAGLGKDSRIAPFPVLLGCGFSMLKRQCSSRSVGILHFRGNIVAGSIKRFHGIIIEKLRETGIRKSPKASCKGSEEASDSEGAHT